MYLLLKWGDQEGKVVIELNGTANPKCAYNFKCLCTGEKGVGELTGLPLCFQIKRGLEGMNAFGPDADGDTILLGIIWGITAIATISVVSGVHVGIKILSQLAFSLGLFIKLKSGIILWSHTSRGGSSSH